MPVCDSFAAKASGMCGTAGAGFPPDEVEEVEDALDEDGQSPGPGRGAVDFNSSPSGPDAPS